MYVAWFFFFLERKGGQAVSDARVGRQRCVELLSRDCEEGREDRAGARAVREDDQAEPGALYCLVHTPHPHPSHLIPVNPLTRFKAIPLRNPPPSAVPFPLIYQKIRSHQSPPDRQGTRAPR